MGLEVFAHGNGFAAGAANVALEDSDKAVGDTQLQKHRDIVLHISRHLNLQGIQELCIVGVEVDQKNLIDLFYMKNVGHFQLPFGCTAPEHHDGIGRLQGIFRH